MAFNGNEIIGGTEESHKWLESLPSDDFFSRKWLRGSTSHCDVYSSTKQEAEKIVAHADGKMNASRNRLKTCTLR